VSAAAGTSAAGEPAAVAALAELRSAHATLATAESLTGGLIGQLLTSVPGASRSYVGGVISYATRLKAALADVPQPVLDAVGPVAEQTAAAMATGVAQRCAADRAAIRAETAVTALALLTEALRNAARSAQR
jgi:PncC family amidohydrolase